MSSWWGSSEIVILCYLRRGQLGGSGRAARQRVICLNGEAQGRALFTHSRPVSKRLGSLALQHAVGFPELAAVAGLSRSSFCSGGCCTQDII